MSWKENRRRKRTWYGHYRDVANRINELITEAVRTDKPIAGEAILMLFFELYERRRLHGKRRIADSALESLALVIADTGLDKVAITPRTYKDRVAGVGIAIGSRDVNAPAQVGMMWIIDEVAPNKIRPNYPKDNYDTPDRAGDGRSTDVPF